MKAAATARSVNPVNAPLQSIQPNARPLDPLSLTLNTTRYWGPFARTFSVSFMESTPADLRARIIGHFNAWNQWCGLSFTGTAGTGDVRISRGPGGYWSYLGTDILLIPTNRPTMNLQGFTMATPESEFHRVVRHECGHSMGFPHEHMRRELVDRIDPEKAYAYFWRTQRWDRAMVDAQVLTPLDEATHTGTPNADQDSIMCYQLPGEITRDGQPIRGGLDISGADVLYASQVYPKWGSAPGTEPATGSEPAESATESAAIDEWDESEDVVVPV